MKTQTTKKTYIYEETDLTRKPDRRDQDTSDDEPSILSPPMKRKLSADSDDLQIVDMSTRRCQGVSSEPDRRKSGGPVPVRLHSTLVHRLLPHQLRAVRFLWGELEEEVLGLIDGEITKYAETCVDGSRPIASRLELLRTGTSRTRHDSPQSIILQYVPKMYVCDIRSKGHAPETSSCSSRCVTAPNPGAAGPAEGGRPRGKPTTPAI